MADQVLPEFQSVAAFVEYLLEDDRDGATHAELVDLSYGTRTTIAKLRRDLEAWGVTVAERPKPIVVRGFTTSSHDRWYGPGAEKMHGGSGWEQITGFTGRRG